MFRDLAGPASVMFVTRIDRAVSSVLPVGTFQGVR